MQECLQCGIANMLPIYPVEEFGTNTLVKWKCFEKSVVGINNNNEPRKRIREVYKETPSSEFVAYFKAHAPEICEAQFHYKLARLPL